MNKKGNVDCSEVVIWILLCLLLVLLFVILPLTIYDSIYIKPVASQNANKYCQNLGWDFYEDYERIGFLSKEPVAIKCKYVEQYRKIDINKDVGVIIG